MVFYPAWTSLDSACGLVLVPCLHAGDLYIQYFLFEEIFMVKISSTYPFELLKSLAVAHIPLHSNNFSLSLFFRTHSGLSICFFDLWTLDGNNVPESTSPVLCWGKLISLLRLCRCVFVLIKIALVLLPRYHRGSSGQITRTKNFS